MKNCVYGFVTVLICLQVWAGPGDCEAVGTEPAPPPTLSRSAADQTALELGYKVQAIRLAIENPAAPGALKAVTSLGLEQPYYVMVRGWLAHQLQADLSLLDAAKSAPPEPVKARVDFLRKAIRAIDLE